ncbi:MAG: acyl-CoA dehydrogenase family protein [Acidimicrobiia bacterium]
MHLELSEDQEFFRETTRRFLESEVPLTEVRALYDHPAGYDESWWRQACELGWTSMYVPEAHGGGSLSGRPTCDAVMVAEEMGRLVSPGPFGATNVVAAALARAGSDALQAAVLPALLSGDAVASWAFGEAGGAWSVDGGTTTLTAKGDGYLLNGTKSYVEAATTSKWFLVTATSVDGPAQVLVAADAAGVAVTSGRSVDMTRRFGKVAFTDVSVGAGDVVGPVGGAKADVEYQLQVAIALQCAELVGMADHMLTTTLEYAQERFAFGRPIASFQAIKHRVADMVGWLEYAKAVTDDLALAIDTGRDDVVSLASVAKAWVGEKGSAIIDECVQITGGIGVTWEHDLHLYNRRAVVNRAVLGTPEEHKLALCALIEA